MQSASKQTSKLLRVAGCDPGFRFLGIAVLEKNQDQVTLLEVKVVETKKGNKKGMRDLRVAADDQRRLKEFWDAIGEVLQRQKVTALGVEGYAPWPGQTGGSAWKVGFGFQMVVCCGWAHGLLPMVFRPDDLKRRLLGQNSGTKGEVEAALRSTVAGFEEALEAIPKTKREHAADAVGHAYLALEEVEKMHAMYGVF